MSVDFLERLQEARQNGLHCNCIGTALFLTGEKRNDDYIDPSEVYKKLRGLEQLDEPVEGCLIVWHEPDFDKTRWTAHMGVVTLVDPLLVTHRDGYNGSVIADIPFVVVHAKYGACQDGRKRKVGYYMPRCVVRPRSVDFL